MFFHVSEFEPLWHSHVECSNCCYTGIGINCRTTQQNNNTNTHIHR